MNANYAQISNLIAARKPFKHGDSMSARLEGSVYLVYSYQTLIAYHESESGVWWVNPAKYSRTTTRQQNLIRAAIS